MSAADRLLIVNADDFGLSQGVNRGIARAHEDGVVTSASLMVRPGAAAEAAAYAREHPRLSVGLHLDLGEWVHADGGWTARYEVVPHDDRDAVRAEVAHQLHRFRELIGRDPTHLDSHQHVHRSGPARTELEALARGLGVPLRQAGPGVRYCGDFYGQTGEGEAHHPAIAAEALIALIRSLPAGVTELACHPGEPEELDSVYREERAMELAALCDPRVRRALEEADVRLCSFADLPRLAPAAPPPPVPVLRPITRVREHRLESEEAFTFVVAGESRPTLPRMPWSAITQQVMREIRLLRPAFVLFTGDAIWGFDDSPQELRNELDRFRALADATGVPFYNAPGNHEMQSDPSAIEILQERGHQLYGSFDVGAHHFVALNTDEFCKEGRICEEQLAWLERDLAASRGARATFVFMHRPLFSEFQGDFNPDDAEVLLRLFREHPVAAVFASHDHFYALREEGGVRYVTSGGGGAPLYAPPDRGGFAHYLLVTVGPEGIDHAVIEPFHLEAAEVAGNDGLRLASTLRVANTTDRDLTLRGLELRCPRLASAEGYRLEVDFSDYAREPATTRARVAEVTDAGDGSAIVRVEADVPTGSAFHLTVHADL
ncbi:MAG: hypothetical protein QOD86_755 [Miltoncostaeaceae bacterium]|nr:hypothetical protein [Miltoncostaeaceae bacterium]